MPGIRIWQGCEYARVTQGAEYAWISLNMSWLCLMQYIAESHCTNYWAVIDTEVYSEHFKTHKMDSFAKRIMPECRHTTRKGRGGFMELGHFSKHFVKNTRKKDPTGKNFGVFSPRYYYILSGKFNPKMDTIRAFLSKIRALFLIFKKVGVDHSNSLSP